MIKKCSASSSMRCIPHPCLPALPYSVLALVLAVTAASYHCVPFVLVSDLRHCNTPTPCVRDTSSAHLSYPVVTHCAAHMQKYRWLHEPRRVVVPAHTPMRNKSPYETEAGSPSLLHVGCRVHLYSTSLVATVDVGISADPRKEKQSLLSCV